MMSTMLQVAVGAAIGGAARHAVGVAAFRLLGATAFPLAVITVNVVGSFLMGLFVVISARQGLGAWNPFVMTGILGGFTTFSAFSLETMTLLERGQTGLAAAYVLGSVVLSVGGLFAGLHVARSLVT